MGGLGRAAGRTVPVPSPPPADDVDDHDEAQLRVGRAKAWAGGIPAFVATLRQSQAQLGPVRAVKTLLKINQPQGFDCPGCAWPDPGHTSAFEFCENGAKAVAEEATVRRVTPEFFAQHPVAELAARTDYWLGQQGRLTHPMYRPAGEQHYQPVAWDDAFGIVADALVASGDPDRAVFYTSGRTSNEAAFLYQLFVRKLGTNNLPDCSNMCHESSGAALGQTIGIGKGSVTLDDIYDADLIIVMGQNPGTNHPRMLTALEKTKERGGTIVAINPLREAGLLRFKNPQRPSGVVGRGTELADEYLQIKLGADLALFQYVNRRLVELDRQRGGVIDRNFLDRSVAGFDELVAHLDTLDLDELLSATGLARIEAERLVELVASNDRIIVCWAMGITQHRQAVATIREVVNTVLLRGSIGKAGAGVCPVRGHSNVQGDRTLGIFEQMPESFLQALGTEFGFEPPREHGFDTVKAIHAMQRGEVDVFFAMGGNFLMAAPDTQATAKAITGCKLTVQVSTKLNRSHVVGGQASLILPTLGRTDRDHTGGREQRVTVEDSMTMVHASVGALEPPSAELRSEVDIVCGLAQRALPDGGGGIDWASFASDYDRIRDRIEAVVPGFTDFNRRIDTPGGFALPHPPRDHGTFPTPSGRAHLTCNRFDPTVVPEGRLLLQTLRSHDQYNTTIYGLDDRYRGIHDGRRVVFACRKDLAGLGFADGDFVDVVSEWTDGVERRAPQFRLVAYDVAPGTCAAYFPEANVLVPLGSVADESNTPTSKGVVVRFEKAGDDRVASP